MAKNILPGPLIIFGSLVFNILPICRAISVFPVPKYTSMFLNESDHQMLCNYWLEPGVLLRVWHWAKKKLAVRMILPAGFYHLEESLAERS